MKNYDCIFFDLDHTLWDYETNARETLAELYETHALTQYGITGFPLFFSHFCDVNVSLWKLYDNNLIDHDTIRRERFRQIFSRFAFENDALAQQISDEYLTICPRKQAVMPGAIETLEYLAGKYRLTIVTNGFEEIQHVKLAAGNLMKYFDHIVTSQRAGAKKPSAEIFTYALELNEAKAGSTMMVGDNLITDIGGARKSAIDAVYFNPERKPHNAELQWEITTLSELRTFL